MRRSDGALLAILACAACSESASRAERPSPVAPEAEAVPAPAREIRESPPVRLVSLTRAGAPSEPVKILEPLAGAEIDVRSAGALAIRVQKPTGVEARRALALSLDGARPRAVSSERVAVSELLEPGVALVEGAHDLVLAAVDAAGVALEPRSGGVSSLRFFVGARPSAPSPRRIVCLAPFGTVYGKTPSVVLDFVVVSGDAGEVDVTLENAGESRRARASGSGPFALGAIRPGDHEVTLTPAAGAPPALPGRCGFAYNPELERPP